MQQLEEVLAELEDSSDRGQREVATSMRRVLATLQRLVGDEESQRMADETRTGVQALRAELRTASTVMAGPVKAAKGSS